MNRLPYGTIATALGRPQRLALGCLALCLAAPANASLFVSDTYDQKMDELNAAAHWKFDEVIFDGGQGATGSDERKDFLDRIGGRYLWAHNEPYMVPDTGTGLISTGTGLKFNGYDGTDLPAYPYLHADGHQASTDNTLAIADSYDGAFPYGDFFNLAAREAGPSSTMPSTNPAVDFAIVLWYQSDLSTATPQASWSKIMSKYNGSLDPCANKGYSYTITTDGLPQFFFDAESPWPDFDPTGGCTGEDGMAEDIFLRGDHSITDGEPHMLVVSVTRTVDATGIETGGQATLYYSMEDTVLSVTDTYTGSLTYYRWWALLGGNGTQGTSMRGTLDELAMFQHALSATDVEAIFDAGMNSTTVEQNQVPTLRPWGMLGLLIALGAAGASMTQTMVRDD